ncbi:MAG: protein kinase [Kiritimatiellae bacterium]|nr:protein kinase [Kiritimatiellia bacterium]
MAKPETMEITADKVEKIACRKCGRHLDVSKLEAFSIVECPECQVRQPVPLQLGNFLLLELLGKGGMGAVYRALDQSLGRYVALKVMRKAFGDDKQFVENFFREARAAAALNHRNIVQIYSCGEEQGQPYIVMELVGGGRLDAIIAEGNPMDEVKALEIGIDVAEGLKAANDIGLIHGDVKPANILFDAQATAKVVDFGLARFVNWQQDAGEIWGTPYYIAPEKARGQKVDHRSDIYSLGATMYHVLGAKPPFDGKTATDVVLARLKNPAIGLRVIRPALQPETADVIARMLEADPFMRYPTYASLLADMREALRVAKQEARAIHKKGKKSKAGPMLVTALSLVAGLALFMGGLQFVHTRQERQKPPPKPTVVEPKPVEPEPAQPEPSPKVPPVVQPFTEAGEEAIAKAMGRLAQGKSLAMEEELQGLYDKLPENGMGRYWIRLMQSVPCWEDGRDHVALMYYQEILNAPFEEGAGGQPHPGMMLRSIVRFLMGERDEGVLYIEAARWPGWMRDIVEFYVGLNNLRQGRHAEARSHLSVYSGKEGQTPKWPYSMQAIAKRWLTQIDQWNALRKEVNGWIAAGKPAQARQALDEFRGGASALFHATVDNQMTAVYKAEQKDAEEKARAARLAQQAQVQKDLDKLDEVRTANLPLVTQMDYRKASAALAKLLPEMKSREGQESVQVLSDSYERMDSIKKFLMKSIQTSSFRQPSEMGGDIVGANLAGIRVSLGGMGEMLKPWDQVSVRLIIQMTNFYLADPQISDAERADKLLSLAVLCYHNGGFKVAGSYAEQAVKLDGNIKAAARKLMPDIVAD